MSAKKNVDVSFMRLSGPSREALRKPGGRYWLVVEKTESPEHTPIGAGLALSRPRGEMACDPAVSPARVRLPVPLPPAPPGLGWGLVVLGLLAACAGLLVGGDFRGVWPGWHIDTFGDLGAQIGAALAACWLAMLWEGVLIRGDVSGRGVFGVGTAGFATEPVSWRLGVSAEAAARAVLAPLAWAMACWNWLPRGPGVLSGVAAGLLIYLVVALFPLKPGPGTRLVERATGAEDLSEALAWTVAARFLPARQSVKVESGARMALAAVFLAVWATAAGWIVYLLAGLPEQGASLPAHAFSSLVSLAGLAFVAWLLYRLVLLYRTALHLGGTGRIEEITPEEKVVREFRRCAPFLRHLPSLLNLDWKWCVAPAGTLLINAGSRDRTFYWVHSGSVRVLGRSPEGGVVPLASLNSCSGVGEIALLDDVPRTADVLVTETSLLASTDHEEFSRHTDDDSRRRFRELVLAGQALGRAKVFAGIPPGDCARWLANGEPGHFRAGDTIVEQGRREFWVGLVVGGEAAVSRDGKEIGRLGAGDVFGEMAFLSDRPRAATITAREDVLVWKWEPRWMSVEVDRIGIGPALRKLYETRRAAHA